MERTVLCVFFFVLFVWFFVQFNRVFLFGPSSTSCLLFLFFKLQIFFWMCNFPQSFLMGFFCGMLISDSRLACIFFQEKVAIDRVKLLKKLGPKRLEDLEGKSARIFFLVVSDIFKTSVTLA